MTLRYGPYSIGRLIYYSLIGQALTTAIRQLDDATVLKTSMLQAMLHDFIVPMGVDADVTAKSETVVENVAHDAMVTGKTGYPVNDIIRLNVVNPFASADYGIRGIRPGDEGPCGNGHISVQQEIALAAVDVKPYLIFRRVIVAPLMRIAAASHDSAP